MTQSGPQGLVPAPEPEEEPTIDRSALDLRPDGRIVIAFDAGDVTLRRPTLGQYRTWRLALTEISDDAARMAADARAATEEDEADERLTTEEKLAARGQRVLHQQEASEVAAEKWWSAVFDGLAEEEVPPVEEWPPWLVFGTLVLNDVLTHWRTVPLAPGARSNRPNAPKRKRATSS